MDHLNYHHLHYFWTVAKEGGIQQAARKLRLAHPTISGQIKQLEESMGHRLFRRKGRRLILTDVGKLVFSYAEVIFTTGQELQSALRRSAPGSPQRLVVGVTEVMPKLVVKRLLEPVLAMQPAIRIIVEEDRIERLLSDLAIHAVDVVLADRKVPPDIDVRAFHHLVVECGVAIVATSNVTRQLHGEFPQSLTGAPFILPGRGSNLRRSLDDWLARHALFVEVIAEVADSALIKVLGADDVGAFAIPNIIEKEVCQQFGVKFIGQAEGLRNQFYAISTERRVKNPAIQMICRSANNKNLDHSEPEMGQ